MGPSTWEGMGTALAAACIPQAREDTDVKGPAGSCQDEEEKGATTCSKGVSRLDGEDGRTRLQVRWMMMQIMPKKKERQREKKTN